MTRIAALLFFLFCSVSGYSQNPGITSILKNTEEKLPYYEMVEAGSWILYLPMEFGKSNFSSSQENVINKLKNANIAEIDLVYSDYPAGQDFSVLTKKRLESLEKLLPSVFNDPNFILKK